MLCCLIVCIGGYHLVYSLHRSGIKKEIKAYLATHKNSKYGEHLVFSVSDQKINDPAFAWEEAKKEFRYLGELYDVVTMQASADSIHIFAIKDTRENDLEKQLAEIDQNAKEHSSKSPGAFFSVFYMVDNKPQIFSAPPSCCHYLVFATRVFSANHDVIVPPPRC